jgi:putative nucleotidyltransferase with HDIG domain
MLARRLELPELDRQAVEIAALLHDIGKLAVPEHILSKPGPLTRDERKKMQLHAQIGAEIVSVSVRPVWRTDSARRANTLGRRLFRRAHVASSLSRGAVD